MNTIEEARPMTVATRPTDARPFDRLRDDVRFLLDNLDERAQAIELSEDFLSSLTRDEWAALSAKAARNGVPLRVARAATRRGPRYRR